MTRSVASVSPWGGGGESVATRKLIICPKKYTDFHDNLVLLTGLIM